MNKYFAILLFDNKSKNKINRRRESKKKKKNDDCCLHPRDAAKNKRFKLPAFP